MIPFQKWKNEGEFNQNGKGAAPKVFDDPFPQQERTTNRREAWIPARYEGYT
jgi:hypothetical protein